MKNNKSTSCPNCGDGLWKKPCRSIVFRWNDKLGELVQVCVECLTKPGRLNEARFKENLTKAGWDQDAIEQAWKAITTGEKEIVTTQTMVMAEAEVMMAGAKA